MVVVGLDEAGVGACFGSLWAAAVHLPVDVAGLRDSKTLSEKRRERLRADVVAVAKYGLGEVTNVEIDSLGLGEARRLVFERALDDYVARHCETQGDAQEDATQEQGDAQEDATAQGDATQDATQEGETWFPTQLVVDGTLFRAWRDVPFVLQPRADATVPCVSAASILAKTTRDRQVVGQVAEGDDVYGIRSNKGYLSRAHIDAIRVHGRTPLHRHSYRIRSL